MNGTRYLILILTGFSVLPSAIQLWMSGGQSAPFEPGVMFLLSLTGLAAAPMLAVVRSWTDSGKQPEDKLTSTPQIVLEKPPS